MCSQPLSEDSVAVGLEKLKQKSAIVRRNKIAVHGIGSAGIGKARGTRGSMGHPAVKEPLNHS
jgi:hypothetical protein